MRPISAYVTSTCAYKRWMGGCIRPCLLKGMKTYGTNVTVSTSIDAAPIQEWQHGFVQACKRRPFTVPLSPPLIVEICAAETTVNLTES